MRIKTWQIITVIICLILGIVLHFTYELEATFEKFSRIFSFTITVVNFLVSLTKKLCIFTISIPFFSILWYNI